MLKRFFSEKVARAVIVLLFVFAVLACLLWIRSARLHADALQAALPPVQGGGGAAADGTGVLPDDPAEPDPVMEEMRRELAAMEAALRALEEENQKLHLAQEGLPERFAMEYAGEYHATAYCCEVYPHVCGGNGVTASGTVPTPGITCAADWGILPPGTWVYIEDVGIRRVEDSGSAILGNRLDIAVDTHANALVWPGYGTHRVWVLQFENENGEA